jgi:hypothetical protein
MSAEDTSTPTHDAPTHDAPSVKTDVKATVQAAVDKIADAAPRADPRDLAPGNALDGLKHVDKTILRLNKYVLMPMVPRPEIRRNELTTCQTSRVPRRSLRIPLHIQLLAVYPRIPADQDNHTLLHRDCAPFPHPPRVQRCQNPGNHAPQQCRRAPRCRARSPHI